MQGITDPSNSTGGSRALELQTRSTTNTPRPSGEVVSSSLLAATQQTHETSTHRGSGEVSVVEIPMDDGARLGRHAAAFREEKFGAGDPRAAADFLRRMAQHKTLTGRVRSQNLAEAKGQLIHYKKDDAQTVASKTRFTGQRKNMVFWLIDVVALTATLLNTIMNAAGPKEIKPGEEGYENYKKFRLASAGTYVTLQVALHIGATVWAAYRLAAVLPKQAHSRPIVSKRFTYSGDIDGDTKAYKSAANTLKAAMDSGTVGAELGPLISATETARTKLDESQLFNWNKYVSMAPETVAKVSRQLLVTAGLTANIYYGGPKKPIGFGVQALAMLYSWGINYKWAGPQQEKLLENLVFNADIEEFGPKIAETAARRAGANATTFGPEMAAVFGEKYVPDLETKAALVGMYKGHQQILAGFANTFFGAEQAEMQGQLAGLVGMTPEEIGTRDKLRQIEIRAGLTAAPAIGGAGDGMEVALVSASRPTGAVGPLPSAPLTREQQQELDHLNRHITAQQALRPGSRQQEIAGVLTELEAISTDIEHLANGTWDEIQSARKSLLLSIMEGDVETVGKMMSGRVEKNFVEMAPHVVQRFTIAFNSLALNSSALITWAAIQQLAAAQGAPFETQTRVAVSWGLFVGYALATVPATAKAVTTKNIDRDRWSAAYQHMPPSLARKTMMLAKAITLGVVNLPIEAVRLSNIKLSVISANKTLAEARRRQTLTPPVERQV